MNPYDFVPVDWENSPLRRSPVPHNNLNGLHGTIECKITAETPVFLPNDTKANPPLEFLHNSKNEYFIQGSSLKGMLRSIVETVGPGCWVLFGGTYKSGDDGEKNYNTKLPREFSKCDNPDKLCPACMLFGIVNGDKVHYQGRVEVDDAICTNAVPHEPIYTIILSNPKPHHEIWYLDHDKLAGRKYYFHQQDISTLSGWKISKQGTKQNQYIIPLDRGSTFTFKVTFKGLDKEELSLLLYGLFIEENMRHKIGYAKPAGLGSVRIEPVMMEMADFRSRYKFGAEPNPEGLYFLPRSAQYGAHCPCTPGACHQNSRSSRSPCAALARNSGLPYDIRSFSVGSFNVAWVC